MTQEDLAKKAEFLKGMSYFDWSKFKEGIDSAYEKQKRELERQLQPPTKDDVLQAIQSRFG